MRLLIGTFNEGCWADLAEDTASKDYLRYQRGGLRLLPHQGRRTGHTVATQKVPEGIQFSIGNEKTFWYELATKLTVGLGKSGKEGIRGTGYRWTHMGNDAHNLFPYGSSRNLSILDLSGRRLWESYPGIKPAGETGRGVRILVPSE